MDVVGQSKQACHTMENYDILANTNQGHKMNSLRTLLFILIIAFLNNCTPTQEKAEGVTDKDASMVKYQPEQLVRLSPNGPIGLTFYKDGILEADFGLDQTVEVKTRYEITGDTIHFIDETGVTCPDTGVYQIRQTDFYYSLDLIEDNCGGRIKFILGFWTKPNYQDLLTELQITIAGEDSLQGYLDRGRLYLAMGESNLAMQDFDAYLKLDTTDARVYMNRASTKMHDLEGVVEDCNQAILLDPENKNAYFLRGLARYDLGQKGEACADFETAIELGFSILRIAEQEKCADFWQE